MKRMTCEEARENMSYYLEKTLQPDEMEAMSLHLSSCRQCREEAEQLEEMIGLLHQLPQTPVPDRFDFEWKKALKKEIQETKNNGKRRSKPRWKAMSGVAAVLLVGVLSLAMLQDGLHSGIQEMTGSGMEAGAVDGGDLARAVQDAGPSTPEALTLQTPDSGAGADGDMNQDSGKTEGKDRAFAAGAKGADTVYGSGVYDSGEAEYRTATCEEPGSGPSPVSDNSDGAALESQMPAAQNGETKNEAVITDGGLSRGSSYFSSEDEYNKACADWMEQYLEAINTNDSALFTDIIAKAGINGYTTDMASAVLKLYGDYLGSGTITSKPLRCNSTKMENSYIIEGPRNNLQLSMKTTTSGIQVTETLLNYGPWLSEQMAGTPYTLDDYQIQNGGDEILFEVELENPGLEAASDTDNSDEKQVKEIVWKKTE